MNIFRTLVALVAVSVLTPAEAQLSVIPPNIVATTQNKPMVMLTASKDFTMFWKAYTDFEDIDFDGKVDYTFKPDFSYYGYFDSTKCYTYNPASGGRYEPAVEATVETTVVATVVKKKFYCTAGSGYWSGNFLNWATMSRMDVLRKVLYGGLRSANGTTQAARYTNGDSTTSTTLELSFVPRNSQAFVKYYNGSDLDRLTPFNDAAPMSQGITLCRRPAENSGVSHSALFTPEIRVVVGNYILWNMTEVRSCNWDTGDGVAKYTWQSPTITFLSSNYVSPSGVKATTDANYKHKADTPNQTTNGAKYGSLGPTFTARVQVCVAGKLEPGCKAYGTTVHKPTGLLHEFGESSASGASAARAEFALMMGSYDHNIEAGVLRKGMGEINDEIVAATGQFKSAGAGKGGIIQSFNEITLYGYNVETGQYTQTCHSDGLSNGSCPSWGNPVGELLLESTRFFAGTLTASKTAGLKDDEVGLPRATWTDPISTASDNTVINSLKKRIELYGRGICRPLNMLTISGGVNSYDGALGMTAFSEITSTATAAALTKQIGDAEGITGKTRMVGDNGTVANLQCTGKTISDLGAVQGPCPDGPNFKGTYLGAGVAHFNNTQRIRTDFTEAARKVPDYPYAGLTVRNYGVTMSGGVATIEVPLPGQIECSEANGGLANLACKRVYITPASLDSQRSTPPALPGNMVDFKVLNRSEDGLSGAALVLWQHSMLGEDQDQDMLNSIRWEVGGTTSAPTISIYTQAIESNTGSAAQFGFGYTVLGTGTTASPTDGLHMHSGINKFLVTDPTGVTVAPSPIYNGPDDGSQCVASGTVNEPKKLCSKLGSTGNVVRGETFKTFVMTGATDASLKEPLWFIAKYGGFAYTKDDKTAGGTTAFNPTRFNQWDRRKANGTPCTDPSKACDGNPDNYFYARRPDLLEKSLREILEDIVTSSNTAPAISSAQLQAGDLKVVAAFDATDGSGALNAYALKLSTGNFQTEPDFTWRAHELLTDTKPTKRQIITNRDGADGIPFEWASLDPDPLKKEQSVLKGTGTDAYGEKMLNWIRGSQADVELFRTRPAKSIMGPIVNSNPTIQGPPEGRYFGDIFAGYAEFAETWRNRRLVLWAGAGDGMLHAFDASNSDLGGQPIMSYIPQPLFKRLPEWASASGNKVQAFVDGSPFVGDVMIGTAWHTYLFSSLGRGGKAIFALDVTKAGIATIDTKGTDVKTDDTSSIAESKLDQDNAAQTFAWQLTSDDDPAGDLGYIVSEPTTSVFTAQSGQIARMNNGRFAALFGNGVDSTSGNAALFIVFADGDASGSGGKFKKIVVPIGGANGLSQPTWVDIDNDRVADFIYAGDLRGNLWRFDVRSADPSRWGISYFDKPLFTAKDASGTALPITGAPEFRFHRLGGIVLNIVTGKSLHPGDFPNASRTHGMFGIWDKPAFGLIDDADVMETKLPRNLTQLEERVLNNLGGDTQKRYLTGDAINWDTSLGWYFFFNVSSEMGLNNLTIANDQVLTVTVSPAPPKTGADTDPCSDKPVARLLAVDPITGLPNGVLGSESIKVGDVTTTYLLASIGIVDQKVQFGSTSIVSGGTACTDGSSNCSKWVGANGEGDLKTNLGSGRIFWREIPGLKTR